MFIKIIFATFLISGSLLAQTQSEMTEIALQDFKKADQKLNLVYQKLLKKGDKASDEKLKAAQRAWLTFVDLHMAYLFPLKEGENPRQVYGSAYPMDVAIEKTAIFKARILQLEGSE